MMQVCYSDDGMILFTVDGDAVPAGMSGNWVQMPKQSLGDFSSWRIVQGQLTLWDAALHDRRFHDAVNENRARLIAAGTDVSIANHGLVALQGRPEDQASLQGLAFGAQLRLSQGDNTTLTLFLDRENVPHELTPSQMIELWQKGADFMTAMYARSWIIKKMDPFVTDAENPELWELEP